ncbi:YkyB family protein [Pontibacillus salicampi]|uniref:YkyB family protein n=1 Tax=Pontibacillus salicampi TaxID=1449801 RepID=A0ABV6LIU3_9BACI
MKKQQPEVSTNELAQAIFVVNRHAKTAPEPKQLYTLKKKAIEQLIEQNLAKKVGLHFSDHPKYSHQHSTLLVQVADYYFHIPPKKEDFQTMKHLGNVDQTYRNPKPSLSLSKAKKVLYQYLQWDKEETPSTKQKKKQPQTISPFSPWGQLTTWNKNHTRKR